LRSEFIDGLNGLWKQSEQNTGKGANHADVKSV